MLCGGGRCLGMLGRGRWKFRSGVKDSRKHEPHPFDHTLESENVYLFFLLVKDRSLGITAIQTLGQYLKFFGWWVIGDLFVISKKSPNCFVCFYQNNHQHYLWVVWYHQKITKHVGDVWETTNKSQINHQPKNFEHWLRVYLFWGYHNRACASRRQADLFSFVFSCVYFVADIFKFPHICCFFVCVSEKPARECVGIVPGVSRECPGRVPGSVPPHSLLRCSEL